MSRRILIAEYFCGGGGGRRLPRGLMAQAHALLGAALEDFAALPGVRLLTLRRPGLALALPRPHEARLVAAPGGGGADADAAFAAAFRRALGDADAALVVAPEKDGVLLRLTRAIEQAGVLNLGSAAAAVRIASDKWITHRALERAGVPQPLTALLPSRGAVRARAPRRPPLSRGGAAGRGSGPGARRPGGEKPDAGGIGPGRPGRGWIVKPLDGYACLGLRAVPPGGDLRAAVRIAARHTRRSRVLVQERCEGVDASVSLIGDGRRAAALCLNGQRLAKGETFRYTGGFAPLAHPLGRAALEAARRAAEAIPGLRGYFGVDLVLGRHGVRVVDVNPRLTTSYLLLRRLAGESPAAWILEAARRGRLPGGLLGRLPGSLLGRARAEVSIECPTSSAGTSAASI